MRILNYGSLNIDHVYRLDHLVRPGETLDSESYEIFAGGKGNNQSIALARAGAATHHAGKIGSDGLWLKEKLAAAGVDTSRVDVIDAPTGHAIIQVDGHGENAIVLHGGANRMVEPADAERALAGFGPGDTLLLQNEISAVPDIIALASEAGLRVVFNPAPMHPDVLDYPLALVDLFIVNETEGHAMTEASAPADILRVMRERFPRADTLLTCGEKGAHYAGECGGLRQAAPRVVATDTTAAGDTFVGFFLADLANARPVEQALATACQAAALCVTRPGAADAIPARSELASV